MKCPICPDATLVMMDRQGVEIDYCPQCRGVWLDRGELDKLIELAQSQPVKASAAAGNRQAVHSRPDFVDSDGYGARPVHGSSGSPSSPSSYGYQPKRRKSWLNDIFD